MRIRIGGKYTALLTGPACAIVGVLKTLRHGVGTFAGELGRSLSVKKIMVAEPSEFISGCWGVGVLNLVFERVEAISKLFDIALLRVSILFKHMHKSAYPLLGPRFMG